VSSWEPVPGSKRRCQADGAWRRWRVEAGVRRPRRWRCSLETGAGERRHPVEPVHYLPVQLPRERRPHPPTRTCDRDRIQPSAVPAGMDRLNGMSSLAGNPFECSTSTGVGDDGFHPTGPRTVSCIVLLPATGPRRSTVVDTDRCAVDTTTAPGLTAALSATRPSEGGGVDRRRFVTRMRAPRTWRRRHRVRPAIRRLRKASHDTQVLLRRGAVDAGRRDVASLVRNPLRVISRPSVLCGRSRTELRCRQHEVVRAAHRR